MRTCSLRPSIIIGEEDEALIPALHACISRRETFFVIGDADNLWDVVYVGNVADAHVLAIENLFRSSSGEGNVSSSGIDSSKSNGSGSKGDESSITGSSKSRSAAGLVINISNGEPTTFRDLCLAVWVQFGHVPAFSINIPMRLAWLVGAIAELSALVTGGRPTFTRGSVKDAVRTRYADMSRAEEVLGYVPRVGLDEAVRRSCEVSIFLRRA